MMPPEDTDNTHTVPPRALSPPGAAQLEYMSVSRLPRQLLVGVGFGQAHQVFQYQVAIQFAFLLT